MPTSSLKLTPVSVSNRRGIEPRLVGRSGSLSQPVVGSLVGVVAQTPSHPGLGIFSFLDSLDTCFLELPSPNALDPDLTILSWLVGQEFEGGSVVPTKHSDNLVWCSFALTSRTLRAISTSQR